MTVNPNLELRRSDSITLLLILLLVVPFTILEGIVPETRSRIEQQSLLISVPAKANVSKITPLTNRIVTLPANNLLDLLLNVFPPLSFQPNKWSNVNFSVSTLNKLNPHINGSVSVTSNDNISLLIMNQANYQTWQRTGQAQMLRYSPSTHGDKIDFIPSADGLYFVLMRKVKPTLAETSVHLTMQLSWQQTEQINKTTTFTQPVTITENYLFFSPQNFTVDRIILVLGLSFGAYYPFEKLAGALDKRLASRRKRIEPPAGIS